MNAVGSTPLIACAPHVLPEAPKAMLPAAIPPVLTHHTTKHQAPLRSCTNGI